jgi:6-phosphogluconolactonase (cycloisomerase 2 family)
VSDEFPSAFSEFAIGSQIAGYRLEEQIGRGGMAVVYRAYDPRLDRYVALKILAPGLALDDAFRQRFIRESRAAAAVDHPNIIPVFDAGEAKGVLFIAMRFVHGGDVRTLLDAVGPLPAARAADITSQVASALDAAHARGLVHRDVKPANMLLDATAGGDRRDHVYLSDFGLSKQSLSQTGLTAQGQFLGTLDYVAPEQVEGRPVDGRADQYALACASFELLSGTPPFKRDGGLAVVWAKLSEDPPLLSPRREDLPAAIDDVMTRGMARAPDERFGNCGEFAAALREVLGLRSPDSGPRSVPPASRPPTEIAMPTVPPAARGSDPGVAAPAGAAPDPRSAARLAAGSAAAAASGAAVGSAAGSAAPPGQAAPSAPGGSAGGSAPSAPAGSPTEVAQVPGTGSTRPGLTEPSLPVPPPTDYRVASDYPLPPDYRTAQSGPAPVRRVAEPRGRGPQGAGTVVAPRPRPAWWRSRGAMAAAAVIVVLGVVGGVFAALHHSNTSTGSGGGGGGHGTTGQAVAVKLPACSMTAAKAHQVSGVRIDSATVGGSPFGVVVTPDGRYSFVSTGNGVAVLNNDGGSLAPTQVATVPASGAQKDEAITSNGRYLLAAAGSGAYVISVSKAEAGDGSGAVLGTLAGPPGNPANEVLASADGKLVFITFQNNGDVAVFNLHQAIAGGFGQAGYLGMVQLGAGSEPQAMAQSPDGRWLYVTGESQSGRLYVVDISKAATDPQHAVTSSAAAGCAPARVIVSANGNDVWVTDRDANALLAFSAEKLRSDPSHSLIAQVGVGQTPIGLTFVSGGTAIMVADANTRGVPGADNLALVSTRLALLGQGGALQGFIPSGAVPRELAVVPGGKTLLVTNNTNSGQLQAVDLGSLP